MAWIDTGARNETKGRSIIFIGNHLDDGDLKFEEQGTGFVQFSINESVPDNYILHDNFIIIINNII